MDEEGILYFEKESMAGDCRVDGKKGGDAGGRGREGEADSAVVDGGAGEERAAMEAVRPTKIKIDGGNWSMLLFMY